MKDAPGAQKVGVMHYGSVERWDCVFNSVLGVYEIERVEALSESVEHSFIPFKYARISVSGYLAEHTG